MLIMLFEIAHGYLTVNSYSRGISQSISIYDDRMSFIEMYTTAQ